MNMALLDKWWWRLLDSLENTICRILKEKYETNRRLWNFNQIGPLPLHTSGRGAGSYIYTLGTTKIQLGNECDINFWRDKWLDNEQLCHSFPNLYHNCG